MRMCNMDPLMDRWLDGCMEACLHVNISGCICANVRFCREVSTHHISIMNRREVSTHLNHESIIFSHKDPIMMAESLNHRDDQGAISVATRPKVHHAAAQATRRASVMEPSGFSTKIGPCTILSPIELEPLHQESRIGTSNKNRRID